MLAPAAAPSLVDYPVQSIPQDGDDLDAASVSQALETPGNYIAYLQDVLRNMIFGDGSDGDCINAGLVLMSGPKFYDTASVTTGGNQGWWTCGWPIICRTKFTLNHSTAQLRGDGNGAVASTRGDYQATGGPHGSITPSNGLASGSYPFTGAAVYGLGGNGGTGGGGGTTGTQVVSPANQHRIFPYRFCGGAHSVGTLFAGSANPYPGIQYDAIRGGGAGGNGGIEASSTGGAGGAAGALVVVMAPTIELLAGNLSSIGGNGGAGQGTTGHGGGGGGGGAFLFVCETFIDAGLTYTVTGGTGGLGVGGGSAGASGAAGNATPFVVYVRT